MLLDHLLIGTVFNTVNLRHLKLEKLPSFFEKSLAAESNVISLKPMDE